MLTCTELHSHLRAFLRRARRTHREQGEAGTGDCSGATYRAWLYDHPVPSLCFDILELPNLKLPFPEGWCHPGEAEPPWLYTRSPVFKQRRHRRPDWNTLCSQAVWELEREGDTGKQVGGKDLQAPRLVLIIKLCLRVLSMDPIQPTGAHYLLLLHVPNFLGSHVVLIQ